MRQKPLVDERGRGGMDGITELDRKVKVRVTVT